MRWVADFFYLLGGWLYLPVAMYHALIVGKNRGGWSERFGFVRIRPAGRTRIWIHAVSLGEVNATPKLVESLRRRMPDCDVVFSTTTDTGYARAVKLYGADHVFRFPLDFSLVISRVLRRVQPAMIVLVELEVWYNLTRMASRRGVPVVVVNGRLTERSARRLAWLGRPARSMFGELAWVGAQDEAIAARFRRLGVRSDAIEITSSMKWDTADVVEHIEGDEELARALGVDGSRPVWVCGSTGPGEEEMILGAYRVVVAGHEHGRASPGHATPSAGDGTPPGREHGRASAGHATRPPGHATPSLVIVPRKPERFEEVARLIEQAGFRCLRRSRQPDGAEAPQSGDALPVILGDTMGELRKFYNLADVVFVGRSLVPMGGSDPIEAAALGKPIVVGPHTENFSAAVEALRAADAIRIARSPNELAPILRDLLASADEARALGARAREVVVRNQGATERTARRLVEILESGAVLRRAASAVPHAHAGAGRAAVDIAPGAQDSTA